MAPETDRAVIGWPEGLPVHLTQNRHPRFHPDGDPGTADCGPAALAMALAALGLEPRDAASSSPRDRIDGARYSMFSDSRGRSVDPEKDGYERREDGTRVRSPRGHRTLTNLVDLERGARNSGARTWEVADLDQALERLAMGCPVVLAGEPEAPGSYGPRCGVRFPGGHFTVLAGYLPERDEFVLNDPLSGAGAITVDRTELLAFLAPAVYPGVAGLAVGPASAGRGPWSRRSGIAEESRPARPRP